MHELIDVSVSICLPVLQVHNTISHPEKNENKILLLDMNGWQNHSEILIQIHTATVVSSAA